MKHILLTSLVLMLGACGKQGAIVPPNQKTEIKNIYPAPSCMDKLTDIKQSESCAGKP